MSQVPFQQRVRRVLNMVEGVLMEKNRKYGDAALNPARIFSNASPEDAIRIRIDDKLKRLMNKQTDDTEDVELDIMGYLVLLAIAKQK